MNQLYRALHMPPQRLLKKLTGHKEIYTIAVRPAPVAEGCDLLPALGGGAFVPLPETPGVWYADPLLFHHASGRWLFCEAFDLAAGRGSIAAASMDDNGAVTGMQVVLQEDFHLSFPTVFDWNGEIWMIPEASETNALILYRCVEFPGKWEQAARFPVGRPLCDAIVMERIGTELTLLCSEIKPENGLYTRYRRYFLGKNGGAEGETAGGFTLTEDEPFNLQHREYGLGNRNAGPLFRRNGQTVRPAQVSTRVDYGVYLQFWARRGASEVPLCAAMPQNLTITGLDPQDLIGIHTYCRDDKVEVIDARYLRKVR